MIVPCLTLSDFNAVLNLTDQERRRDQATHHGKGMLQACTNINNGLLVISENQQNLSRI